MGTKRKHVVLNIETQYEIIKAFERGENATELAQIHGVGRSTITDIKNRKCEIESYIQYANSSDASIRKKSLINPKNKIVDDVVFQWFRQKRDRDIPISGSMLCEKALELNERLKGDPNFKASNG
jgi:hypothetical protein